MKRKSLILIVLLFLSSCSIFKGIGDFFSPGEKISETMASWLNNHYSQLLASWGPPQQVFDDGLGGRILNYTMNRQFYFPGTSQTNTTARVTSYDNYIWGSATSRTVYNPARIYGYTAYRMFWINKNGIIYNWKWQGL